MSPSAALQAVWLLLLLLLCLPLALAAVTTARALLERQPGEHAAAWLAAGLHLALFGAGCFAAGRVWPQARTDNAFLGLFFIGQSHALAGGLLLAAALPRLAGARHPRAATLGLLASFPALVLLVMLTGEIPRRIGINPLSVATVWGALLALAGALAALALQRAGRPTGRAATRAAGVALLTAAPVLLLLAARGPEAWNSPPYGFEVTASAQLAAVAAYLVLRRRIARRASPLMVTAVVLLYGSIVSVEPLHAAGPPASRASGPPLDASALAAVDDFVEAELRATRMPGAALAIVQGDRVVHLRSFGRADPSGRPVTPHTPFAIGSVTKSFTALAVMQLVEAGSVDLDAPVRRYLPWFRVADEAASEQITVRHLLTMTSGLATSEGVAYLTVEDTSPDAIERRVRTLREAHLTAPVGSTFQYSNGGYAALGALIEAVSGLPYEDYVRRSILEPLGMRHSYASQPEAERHGMATGHRYWFGFPFPYRMPSNRAEMGAGFLICSAEDLARYMLAHLNRGQVDGVAILSPQGIAELHRPAVPRSPHDDTQYYAMGWFIRPIAGRTVLAHGGVNPHFHSTVILDPEQQWGLALLMNGENALGSERIAEIASGAASLLLGQPPAPLPPPNDMYRTILGYVLAALALQIIGLVWSLALIRRWRTPERRPRTRLTRAWHLVPSLATNAAWAAVCLLAVPTFLRWPLNALITMLPDFGLALTASGGLALLWGPLRALLVLHAWNSPTARI